MSDEQSPSSPFRFRLSFVLCLVLLAACFMAGIKEGYDRFWDLIPVPYLPVFWLSGPMILGTLLLIGSNDTARHTGIGLLLSSAFPIYDYFVWGLPYQAGMQIAWRTAALFGVLPLLHRQITVPRLLLASLACFTLGNWCMWEVPLEIMPQPESQAAP